MIGRLLKFVEIRTKVTSVLTFLLALAYLFSVHVHINAVRTALFFASMFLFDLTTTAINNYIDTKTIGQELPFRRPAALGIILVLFLVSAALGIALACVTDIVVLLVGALCFLCGVAYTYSPVPISRMPLGEVVSGFFYGILIPFLLLYINSPAGAYLSLTLTFSEISLRLQVLPLITLVLLGAIPFCATANIMLANNICDLERDIAVHRYTLPFYLGKGRAVLLFWALCYIPYGAVILLVLLGAFHPVCLLALLTAIPVQKNINRFRRVQDKEKTFPLSAANFVIQLSACAALVFVGGVLKG